MKSILWAIRRWIARRQLRREYTNDVGDFSKPFGGNAASPFRMVVTDDGQIVREDG